MQVEKVDVIGAQALQAGLNRAHHALAMIPTAVRVRRVEVQRVFAGDDEAIPPPLCKFADEFFRLALRVEVRRVDEVAAGADIGVEYALCGFAVHAPIGLGKGHRAQARSEEHTSELQSLMRTT